MQTFNIKPTNYCVPGVLSKCTAGTTWADQLHCRFAVKAKFSNKCMHHIEAIDGHCDCMDAQKDAVIIFEDLYD